jgi:kynurenine formamidase
MGTMSDTEFREYFTTLSNWGRWGHDDQKGTLNLLTDETRLAAAQSVKYGEAIGCSRVLSPVHAPHNPEPILHHMTVAGEGDIKKGFQGSEDWFGMGFHGYGITHLDALSHVFWDGILYNNRPSSLIKAASGARVLSAEQAGDGILGRGVLLDIPRLRNVEWLELGEPIGPDELIACAKSEGINVRSGDILLVRVGRDVRFKAHGPSEPEKDGTPGLHASCLPLLREWDVAAIGSDATNDVMPSQVEGVAAAVHAVGIVAMGLWLFDSMLLEPLAEACARYSKWDFLFSASPLMIKNSTGSPVNPVALL